MTLLAPALAFAQASDAPEAATEVTLANSPYASLLPLLLIFAVFYILLIRPQQKRMKEHQTMLGALQKGDEVVTGGGIIGKITKADAGDHVTVEIAKGVEVRVLKSTVSAVLGKTVAKPAAPEKKKTPHVKNDNSVVSRENIANDN